MIIDQTSSKFLITGGRAPATLELVRLLSNSGHCIYAAESLKHHLCSHSKHIEKSYIIPSPRKNEQGFIQQLIDIIQAENIDYLIPTCEEGFYISKGYDQLSAYCSVFTSPIEIMRALHSKWDCMELLRSYNLNTPVTWLIHNEDEARQIIYMTDPQSQLTWVLKPEFSRFSNHVMIFKGKSLPKSFMRDGETWVLQHHIGGQQVCTFGIAVGGSLKAHASYAVQFTAGQGACINFRYEGNSKLIDWVRHVVKSLDYTGQISFDLILTKDGSIYPIECNPRLTSGIHLFTDEDQIDQAFTDSLAPLILPKTNRKSMLTLAMILYGLPQVRSLNHYKTWLHTMITSKDVLFRWNDLSPFFSQFRMVYELMKRSRKLEKSMIECSTADIEWNGDL